MNNLVPINEIQTMAEVAAKSKMFGFKNTEEAMAIMLLCQAENLHPAIAMRDYHVIQGRPALKADAMLARFQQVGGKVDWKEYTDEVVTGLFSHPQGGTLEVTWTLAKAKLIGIANKDNWKNYSRAMLRARCVSEGIRSVYPGCVVGVYTPEETQDFTPPVVRTEPKAVPEVEVLRPLEDVQEADGAYKLMLPNSEEPYARYHTQEEWLTGYVNMASRIYKSEKFSVEQKDEKLQGLASANTDYISTLSSFDKIKIKAELVKAGVNPSPKSVQSLTPLEEERNEETS
jgi:hypothetical protein